ncbi:hypothetical protein [Croceimicrobium hydrocarbonivorans]|uniref:Uncharacterized protein n=1 Tax=Croceimicrobium hydrocarbonivorans TaxID=2761580 RepID=A0A7H0VB54_9FLAO|nr:hypothetical protein [Croceimicrobium hydrocarbonivorans]QNR22952.1 hypothetical protein H4K34_11240 [Croceimicrobium hydrocarbonivorans]QNR22995.1 hypothetical protein H4K34_11455 [Croceimicrobium hydrocarbonivorans]
MKIQKPSKALAVEVMPSAQYEQAYKQASIGRQVNNRPISNIGAVAQGGGLGFGSDIMPETITANYANETATPVTVMLFDPLGINAGILGGTYVDPTSWSGGLSNALIKEFFKHRPSSFKGFNYRVTTGSAAQFDQAVKWHKGQIDGSSVTRPLNIGQYQRNTQQNTLIQTIDTQFYIDQFSAMTFVVGANTTIAVDFVFGEVLNSVVGG